MRQFADKTHRVGNQNREVSAKLDPANQRIERGEEPTGNQRVFFRQRSKQGGLARVGVSDQRNQGQLIAPTPFAVKLPVFSDLLDVATKRGDAMPDLPSVHFQFRFAGASGADSAAETRQVIAITG